MTTMIIIKPSSHAVLIETYDRIYLHGTKRLSDDFKLTSDLILKKDDTPHQIYATTTREIRIVDLEENDVRLLPDPRNK